MPNLFKNRVREKTRPPGEQALRKPAVAAAVLAVVTLLIYGNTIRNDYALDDGIVITENQFTRQGFAGLGDIFSQDSFAGALAPGDVVTGGRYRPLSIATFAVEWELFGENPHVSHLINLLLYLATILLILRLCHSELFPQNTLIAFLSALFFAVHPVHTEAVANIKGRDELLVFLFLLLLLLTLFHSLQASRWYYLASLAFFVLALFSKETALTYLAVVPAALWCFTAAGLKRIAHLTLPYAGLAALFLLLRFAIIGFPEADAQEILNAPYLYASVESRYATIVYVLGKYVTILFWPAILSNDYSFNQIPLRSFADPQVWLSAATYLTMIILIATQIRSRRAYAFAVTFYLVTLSISSNIFANIGAPMAERLLYVPSFGFALFAAILLGHIYHHDRLPGSRWLIAAAVVVAALLGGARTAMRNGDWKNDETLLLADVRNAPNSARTQKAAGGILIKLAADEPNPNLRRSLLERSIRHLNRAIEIYPAYLNAHIDLGMAYRLSGESGKAEVTWRRLEEIRPDHSMIPTLRRLLADSFRAEGLRLIAGGRYLEGLESLRSSLRYQPKAPQTYAGIGKAYTSLGDYGGAAEAYREAAELQPENPDYWYLLGDVHFRLEEWEEAGRAWSAVLALSPSHAKAIEGLQMIESRTSRN